MQYLILKEAERKILNRPDEQLTVSDPTLSPICYTRPLYSFCRLQQSLAGYAGGLKTGNDGTVCYHNPLGKSEYGKLGHTEVVNLDIPEDKLVDFAKTYFAQFKGGDRPDKV